ncbi:MAG TPA: polyphosphate kinase 1 [Vicinamibacterales bacterium]|nr:polyphosphate kinase 1 [Vicinamibacterales bacterium]
MARVLAPAPARLQDAPESAIREAALSTVWVDRDLGWMEFNRRVLNEALDERTPLLERAKFLAIFTSNLDEFFMKRMAVLREHRTPERQQLIARIRERLEPMLRQRAECFRDRLVPELARHGIHLRHWESLSEAQRREASAYFDTQVSAALTPLVIQPSQPFPFFSNLSLSISFQLHDDRTGESVDARVKVPSELAQWVPITTEVRPGERLFVRLHEIIQENAHKLYPGMRLTSPTLFRLTRDAEVELDDEKDRNVRDAVREQIRQRRFEPVVRLEFAGAPDRRVQLMLQERFGLLPRDVYVLTGEIDYSSLFEIANLDLPELRDAPWMPAAPSSLRADTDMFEAIQAGDILVHHPYESFSDSVERFIETAARDPRTLAIKMTVYRVGDDTPFVRSLIQAAESGKQVACVIELKARFDEERNLHWAAELERVGAHVTVGDMSLKTHAKVALVVRKEAGGLRTYAHVGTGNYHVRTARIYSDVGLLTCDPAITGDVVNLFHHLTGRSEPPDFQRLLVAPKTMRQRFLDLIARETANQRAGRPARIVGKMNQLEDPAIIAALCEASRAGVAIDLIVRGFCCLRPGVAGFSESVSVRSVIGRFLEHSRIFYFAAGSADPLEGEFFIGSADWMFRNLSHRVEVVAPVVARHGREKLWEILEISLQDRRQAWVMGGDGEYTQLRPDPQAAGPETLGTHQALMDLTRRRAH